MRRLIAALLLFAVPAGADVPNVVTDIAPVRAIVARVMAGVGTPAQLIPNAASPHGYAMRPSEARALTRADLVVWVGPGLTSWLEGPITTLAPEASQMVLMAEPDTVLRPFREGIAFEADNDGHDHDHDHGHDQGDHAALDDPHVWLDPRNARLWAGALAERLAALDAENAAAYRANARSFAEAIDALEAEIAAMFDDLGDAPFIVLHDGFHYFEARFGVEAMAAVALADGVGPGPARLRSLRDALAQSPAICAFAEPQMDVDLLRTATEGQSTRIATLDAIGADGGTYDDLLRGIAVAMHDCLSR